MCWCRYPTRYVSDTKHAFNQKCWCYRTYQLYSFTILVSLHADAIIDCKFTSWISFDTKINFEEMEAKCVEQYLCLVLAGKCWHSIKLSGDTKAIQLPVTNHCFLTDTLCFILSRDHENFICAFLIYIFLVYDIVLLLQPCLKVLVFI